MKGLQHDLSQSRQAAEGMRQPQQQYETLVNSIDGIVWEADAQTFRFSFVSRQAERLLGYPVERWLTEPNFWSDHIHPDDREEAMTFCATAMQEKRDYRLEYRMMTADGNTVWLKDIVTVVVENGQAAKLRGVMVDITARKRAEEALRESEARYRNLVENANDIIYTHDFEGNFTSINAAGERTYGYTREEMQKAHISLLVDPDYLPIAQQNIQKKLQGVERTGPYELLTRTKDGAPVWIEVSTRLLKEKGQPIGVQGIARDITARKRTEEALRESKNRLQYLVSAAPAVIYCCQPAGDYAMNFISENVTALFGYEPQQFYEDPQFSARRIHPQDAPRFWEELSRLFERGHHSMEYRFRHRDGTYRWIHDAMKLVRDVDGNPLEIVGYCVDITERKQAERRGAVFATLGQQLSSATTPKAAARIIVEAADELLGWDACVVDLYSPEQDTVHPALRMDVVNGQRQEVPPKRPSTTPGPVMRRVIEKGEQLILRDEPSLPSPDLVRFGDTSRPSASLMFVPIRHGERVTGILSIQSYAPRAYNEDDLRTLQALADHCGGAWDRIQAEARYHSIFEDAVEGIYQTTPDGRLITANPALVRMLGYESPEDLIAQVTDLARQVYVDSQRRSEVMRFIEERGVVQGFEVQLYRKDGSQIWVSLNARAARAASGAPLYYEGTLEDITERKRAEQVQAVSYLVASAAHTSTSLEDLFQYIHREVGAVIDANNFYIALCDAEPGVVSFPYYVDENNPDEPAVTPRSRKLGRGLTEYVINSGQPLFAYDSTILELAEKGDIEIFEPIAHVWLGAPLKSGDKIIGVLAVQSYTSPLTYTQGDLEFLEFVSGQIGGAIERKWASEHLTAEKERLAVTLRSIADGVITTDTDGNVVLLNHVAAQLTGWTDEEAKGKLLTEVFHLVHEKTRAPYKVHEAHELHELINSMDSCAVLIARDGTERLIEGSGAPLRDPDGRVIGAVWVFRDITEKRRMEAELLKVEKLESLGVLAGGIAHDFNNILTAVLGNVSLAMMPNFPPEEMMEILREAEQACLRARDLTQQLLTFTRGGAPILQTASMADLLRDSTRFTLRGSNVGCEFFIPDDLWAVEMDEGQMSQVIHNLVLNAQQAMPQGGVVKVQADNVTISTLEGLPLRSGRYVKVALSDEGVGIPEEHLPKIFDPYFTTKPGGNGLGLASAYSIIKNHEGHITVESEVGVGSTFCVYLPASSARTPTPAEPDGGKEISHGRILVMDDEEGVRKVLGEILTHMGYSAEFAGDGAEAIEKYRHARTNEQPFDAVIMDLTVPGGMGGKEAMERLLEIDPSVKAIVSSGYSTDPVMADHRKFGFCGVVAKPYKISDLERALHSVVTGRDSDKVTR